MQHTRLQVSAGFGLWLTVLCLLFTAATSTALESGDFRYEINSPDTNTVTITGYFGAGGAAVIPTAIDSKSVTHIGNMAFSGSSLTSVMIGNSVTNINYIAFNNCHSLLTITVAGDNPAYSDIDGVLFNKDQSTIVQCPGGRMGNYTIPGNVTSIRHWSFHSCTGLTSVIIPDSVTSIGTAAFEDCTGLMGVTIGNGVTDIWDSAFQNCSRLVSVTIPDSVHTIWNLAFAGCDDLTSLTLGNGVAAIQAFAFFSCDSLPYVTIPGSVTSIGSSAFRYCSSLADVYFKGNAPAPGSGVFLNTVPAPVYHLPGTTNWGETYAGRPTALWNPLIQTDDGSFGVQSNTFGFNIAGSSNELVRIEACTSLVESAWEFLTISNLTGGSLYFRDPGYTNHPVRFYHLDMP